jgi:ParB family chromosome partitioning protein
MTNKFNISQLLSNTSLQADGEQTPGAEPPRRTALKVIPLNIKDLQPSGDNFYTVDDVAELKNSIEIFGVVQNLTVKPLESGKYEIISGHRRHKACVQLVAEGKSEYEYVPCGIQSERDEIKERILLIMTNSTTRELSEWEKMKQAEELGKTLKILKKRDNLPGRVRDMVAEALNTSASQVGRMNAINNNLIPELADEFKSGGLSTSAAYELSGLSEEKQKETLAEYKEKGELSINEAKAIKGKPAPTVPAVEPKPQAVYPESPPEDEDEEDAPEATDFADMSEAYRTNTAIQFLNQKRFSLFAPGDDTRVFDFIIEILKLYRMECTD